MMAGIMDDISDFIIAVVNTYADSCGDTLECLTTEDAPRSSYVLLPGRESVASSRPPEIVVTPQSSFTDGTRRRSATRSFPSYFQCDVSEMSSINSSLGPFGGDDLVAGIYSMKQKPSLMLEKMTNTDLVFFPTPASEMIPRHERDKLTMNHRHQATVQRQNDYMPIEQNPRIFSDSNESSRESSHLVQLVPTSQSFPNWIPMRSKTEDSFLTIDCVQRNERQRCFGATRNVNEKIHDTSIPTNILYRS
jgi:hypothetical protein